MDHNLFDVIWPALIKYDKQANGRETNYNTSSINGSRPSSSYEDDFTGHVVAPDYESYTVFAELFDPLIREIHCLTSSGELPDHPSSSFFSDGKDVLDVNENVEKSVRLLESYDLDSSGKYVLSGVIECTRNLSNYPLPLTLTVNQLENSEKEITSVLMRHQELAGILAEGSSEDEPGTYYTLIEVLERPSQVRVRLAAAGLLSPITETEKIEKTEETEELTDEKRWHGKHWPYGRGVYLSADGNLAIWINVQDHIRVICSTSEAKPGRIGKAYVRIAKLMNVLERHLIFKRDPKLGFLSARPSCVGNTLRFHLRIKFPTLTKDLGNLKHLCVVRGLEFKETIRRSIFVLGNQQSLSITELQTLQDFCRAVLNILSLEKEMTLNNSMNIATVIANIFRKRKSSAHSIHS